MTFQLGSVLLDACVLAVLSKEDTYGYKLTQEVQSIVSISESTLYPVLRRLQKDECLETYDMPFQGRNRRYYKITTRGKDVLEVYQEEWIEYVKKINKVLGGGK
ncbi:PadR family transcriptional regulator [Sedimentibacter sp. zth1]|uniref:PadR family transcriptional regulator n=1 Tax=Sedimentibacter sp. zth1 TaxID=2816908 RepID=UPI001A91F841|nr:PadR family transcriptional regulator [Sedimentibacter sp. zth1]QSX05950.1 PadR family transcriptional regulator [Sedimentibacter sp. zth1]